MTVQAAAAADAGAAAQESALDWQEKQKREERAGAAQRAALERSKEQQWQREAARQPAYMALWAAQGWDMGRVVRAAL